MARFEIHPLVAKARDCLEGETLLSDAPVKPTNEGMGKHTRGIAIIEGNKNNYVNYLLVSLWNGCLREWCI